jgi:hypothetical protein
MSDSPAPDAPMTGPPQVGDSPPGSARRFALLLLAVVLLVLFAVAALNYVVDPYGAMGVGLLPTAVQPDRAQKVELIRRLKAAPQIVILGSSRAMKADPAYLSKVTGLRGFNASVTGASPEDTFVFVNLLHDAFPQARMRYLWLLDVESFRKSAETQQILGQRELAKYLKASERRKARQAALLQLVSWSEMKDSVRSLWHHLTAGDEGGAAGGGTAAAGRTAGTKAKKNPFRADGFVPWGAHDELYAHGRTFNKELALTRGEYIVMYRTYRSLDPGAESYVQSTLGLMNSLGARPVIVLTPMHPRLRQALAPLGWERRHQQVLDYLHSLQRRYDFVLVDLTSLSSFGGSPSLFYDGVHMRVRNLDRLLHTAVDRSQGALR